MIIRVKTVTVGTGSRRRPSPNRHRSRAEKQGAVTVVTVVTVGSPPSLSIASTGSAGQKVAGFHRHLRQDRHRPVISGMNLMTVDLVNRRQPSANRQGLRA